MFYHNQTVPSTVSGAAAMNARSSRMPLTSEVVIQVDSTCVQPEVQSSATMSTSASSCSAFAEQKASVCIGQPQMQEPSAPPFEGDECQCENEACHIRQPLSHAWCTYHDACRDAKHWRHAVRPDATCVEHEACALLGGHDIEEKEHTITIGEGDGSYEVSREWAGFPPEGKWEPVPKEPRKQKHKIFPDPTKSTDSTVSMQKISIDGPLHCMWARIDCILVLLGAFYGMPLLVATLVLRVFLVKAIELFISRHNHRENGYWDQLGWARWLLSPTTYEEITPVRRLERTMDVDGHGRSFTFGDFLHRIADYSADLRKMMQYGMDLTRQDAQLAVVSFRSDKYFTFKWSWTCYVVLTVYVLLKMYVYQVNELDHYQVFPWMLSMAVLLMGVLEGYRSTKKDHYVISLVLFHELEHQYNDGVYNSRLMEIMLNHARRMGGVMIPYDVDGIIFNTTRTAMSFIAEYEQKHTLKSSVVFQAGPTAELLELIVSSFKGTLVDSVESSSPQ